MLHSIKSTSSCKDIIFSLLLKCLRVPDLSGSFENPGVKVVRSVSIYTFINWLDCIWKLFLIIVIYFPNVACLPLSHGEEKLETGTISMSFVLFFKSRTLFLPARFDDVWFTLPARFDDVWFGESEPGNETTGWARSENHSWGMWCFAARVFYISYRGR